MRWKSWIAIGLLLIATGFLVSGIPAPTIVPTEQNGVAIMGAMAPNVRIELAEAWTAYAKDVSTPEYAYCITDYRTQQVSPTMILLTITGVRKAEGTDATPSSIVFGCDGLPGIHSHPPTECEQTASGWTCVPWEEETPELCIPSASDLEGANTDWHRFGVVQCGASRFLLFVPAAVSDGTAVRVQRPHTSAMPKKEGFVGSYETRNAGKGDRPRPIDDKQRYDENFERIFGRHPRQPAPTPEESAK